MGLTTTREYRWDDAGAPSLSSATTGSFYTLMKTIAGGTGTAYGSKQQGGWTILYDDPVNFTLVLQNDVSKGGTGGCIRIQDDGSFTGGNRVAKWETFEYMTDIDTGVNPAGSGFVWKGQSTSVTDATWVVVMDERCIYGTVWVGGPEPGDPSAGSAAALHNCFHGGDYDKIRPGDFGFSGSAGETENPSTGVNTVIPSGLMKRRANTNSPQASTSFKVSRDNLFFPAATNAAVVDFLNTSSGAISAPGTNSTGNPMNSGALLVLPANIVVTKAVAGRLRGCYFTPNDMVTNGGAPVGSVHSPVATSRGLSLTPLAGAADTNWTAQQAGRLFVERILSWDDI